MKLFSLDSKYNVIIEPQALLLGPFAALVKRDKTKLKTRATRELAFIYFFCDIRSDYAIHTDEAKKTKLIQAEVKLPENWKIDKLMEEAIDFYKKRSLSITARILKDSMYVANKVSEKMKVAVDSELDVADLDKVLGGLKKIPDVIKSLKTAEREVLKEIEEAQDSIGSKEKALFEDLQLIDDNE